MKQFSQPNHRSSCFIGTFQGAALSRHGSPNRQFHTTCTGEAGRHQQRTPSHSGLFADVCSAISLFLFVIALAGFIAPAAGELFLHIRG